MLPFSRATVWIPSLASRLLATTSVRCCNISKFEPPYLDAGKAEIPEYPPLNVQMKSYDFTVLEHYAKWVHKTALNMGIEVGSTWATPSEKFLIKTFKPASSDVESEYKLRVYERNVQLSDLSSILAPLFMEVIQHGLPEGVELSVHKHLAEYTKIRYIPDTELEALQKELAEMGAHPQTKN